MIALSAAVIVALALGGTSWYLRGLLRAQNDLLSDIYTAPLPDPTVEDVRSLRADYEPRFAYIESQIEDLTLAVAEGIKHVERAENRIKATIGRAREKLAESGIESPGLEAEYQDLQLVDGGGGPPGAMPEVSQGMAPSQSSVPGVSVEQLQRARGY